MANLPSGVDDADTGPRRASTVDVHVGSRVRVRRMVLGMSQEKVAEKLDLTFQQIQKYEKGANRIGASRLFDLAQVLGVSVQYFFEGAPGAAPHQPGDDDLVDEPTGASIVEFLRSRNGLELNRAFLRISDGKARRAIVELVCSLANREVSDNPEAGRT